MRNPIPLSLIAALSILLSACFTSQGPKFPVSSAVAAFGDGGRYVVFEHVGNGKYQKQRTITITKMPDGSHEFVGDKNTLPISFHDIGNGIIVAQVKPNDGKGAYGYLILTQKGSERYLHLPQCDRQDQAMLSANGVVLRDKFECSIDKVADPAKLFTALNAGDPSTKIVPE